MPLSREIHLVRRPNGAPTPADFALVERSVGDAADGEVLVENLWISVDPAMRPRLNAGQPLDEAMMGMALGRVVQSKLAGLSVGDLVTSRLGCREYFTAKADAVTRLRPDPELPLSVYMHALGMTGFTAYGGLLEIGQLKDGEQVFVSTAGGAVGSIAAQIARLKGCRVVGSTGSEAKAAWLRDVAGLDAVINYKTQPIGEALTAATPQGLDVYFDNVGGDHLDAALTRMNRLGRIPVCGFISGYNGGGAPVSNLFNIIYAGVTIRGFTSLDYLPLRPKFEADMTAWLKAGQIKYQETVREGIAATPGALIGMLAGENSGKMLVKLAD